MNTQTQRNPLRCILLLAVFALLGVSAIAAEPVFRAGAAAVDITPPKFPVIANGMFFERVAKQASDRLHARSLALDDGSTKIVFCVVDICMMPRELVDKAKEIAAKATGVSPDHVMISATHTHSGGSVMGCLGSRPDPDYTAWLPAKLAESIIAAVKNLQPARIGWSSVDDWEHTHNRVWIYRKDSMLEDPFGNKTVRAMMHPGYQKPGVVGPSGPVDPGLDVLAVQTPDGKPLALMANYSQHFFGATPVSADYYGEFSRQMAKLLGQESDLGPFVAMMSQGTSGDLNWDDYGLPKRKDFTLESYSKEVAQYALEAYKKIVWHDRVPLGMVQKIIPLNYRMPDAERLEWAKKKVEALQGKLPGTKPEVYAQEALILHEKQKTTVLLQAIRIGDLTISALENEVYAITGLKLRAQAPLGAHFNISLANGAEGYIPPPEIHVLGGYNTWLARTAGLEVQAEPKILETMLDALEEVSGKKRRAMHDDNGPYAEAILNAKPAAYWRLDDIGGTTAANAVPGGVGAHISDGAAWYLPGVSSGTGSGAGEKLTPSNFSGPKQINRAIHLAGGDMQADIAGLGDHYSIAMWFWLGETFGASERGGTLVTGPGGESLESRQFNDHQVELVLGGAASNKIMRADDWHFAVLVRDGNEVRVHLDSGEKPEIVKTLPPTSKGSHLVFGKDIEGRLDEIAVFPRALPQAEITAFWKTGAVKRAKRPPPPVLPAEKAHVSLDTLLSARDGKGKWERLFNGKDFTGFHTHLHGFGNTDPEHVFTVEDGTIHVYKDTPDKKAMPCGGVITDKDYGDYHLRFEFKWGTKKFAPLTEARRDAGLLFHVVGKDGAVKDTWGRSVECQVMEKDVGDLYTVWTRASSLVLNGQEKTLVASLKSDKAVAVGDKDQIVRVIKESDEERPGWNTVEVIARGDAAVYIVNGKPVHYVFNMQQPDPANPSKWIPLTKGRLWFQAEDAEVFYRNIEIRSLPPVKTEALTAAPSIVPPLSPGESLKKLHLPTGFKAEIVAAEPLVVSPVAFDWDERGRLWVVEMIDYPLGMDNKGKPGGRVRVLEDTKGTGHYDKATIFAEGLNFPTGIITWRDGAIVTAAPNILFLRDTNGDGKADEQQVLVSGLQEGNQQLRANGLRWGLDNWVYVAIGAHNGKYGADTRLKSTRTGELVAVGSRDFRFRPDTGELEPQSGPTQFGRNRDNWGRWFGTQNSNPLWHYLLPDQYLRRNPHFGASETRVQLLKPENPPVYPASTPEKRFHGFDQSGHFTSACSGMVLRDQKLFPANEMHAFICEPFHNLVQHARLDDDGNTFSAGRVSGEGQFDFFASEDHWCRPVMVREGPDGSLWVADMYRYMIEHPQWLPQEGKDELLPNYRTGDDRGRLYRVSRDGAPAFHALRFDKMSTAEVVGALDTTNGWQRDKAQQVLLWRKDKAAIPPLREMAAQSANPLARLHALCTLDGLGELAPASVAKALADPIPGVRENALRLAETRFEPDVLAAAGRLADDPDAKVRLQLAFSLGASPDPAAGKALAHLLKAHADEPTMVAAVMTSAMPHLRALAGTGVAMEPLLNTALGLNDRETLAQLLAPTFTATGGRHTPAQLAGFARLLDFLAQHHNSLEKLRAPDDALSKMLANADAMFAQAGKTAKDTRASAAERIAAASLLSRAASTQAEAVKLLTAWLDPQQPADVQTAAIRALRDTRADAVPAALAKAWPTFSPAARQEAFNAWTSRENWTVDLILRLERKELPTSALDTVQRGRLLKSTSKRVKQLAGKIFDASSTTRGKVVESYKPVLTLKGDAAKGHEVYALICSLCHKHGTEGRDIGPDLISVVEHPPEKLLRSILNPNEDIQPGYNACTCTLKNGEQIYGLLASESANSIVMKLLDGTKQTVLRNQIASLQNQDISLMPEGLEAGINHQQMADLIEFLRTPLKKTK